MRSSRLLVVSEYFWPDEASTGRLLGQLVGAIDQITDHDVTVVTSDRLYRSAHSYQLPNNEDFGSVKVVRLHSRRSGKSKFLARLMSDLVFSFQAAWQVLRRDYDCLLVVTNPPLMPLILSMVSLWKSRPMVYLIHDLYPDLPIALHMWSSRSPIVRLIRTWQRKALNNAKYVIVLGRCMQDYLRKKYHLTTDVIRVIPNWFTVDPGPTRSAKRTEEFLVLYSGNLGQFQDFDTLIDAAELLKDHSDIRIYICGNGYRRAYIEEQIMTRQLSNVLIRDFLPEDQFTTLLEQTSLGVVTLEPEMEGLGVPSKSYNLLAMGVPVVAIMDRDAEVSRVIKEAHCGIQVDHGEAQRLADLIIDLAENPTKLVGMSEQARNYAHTNVGLERIAKQYSEVISAAMEERAISDEQ